MNVALVPHDVVGESRHLVFHPSEDDDRGKVSRGQAETEEIRRRLTLALDQESTRLRSARAEFATVRSELTTLAAAALPSGLTGEQSSGVGTVAASSTSVRGAAQPGIVALPPIAALSVSMPDLTGISSAGLAPLAATAASGRDSGRGTRQTANAVPPPMGGMGGGAVGARSGTMSRGMASGRSGPHRLAAPQLPGSGSADDEASRPARDREAAKQAEKEAEKEAKRAALAEKRAERAARRAQRESEHDDRDLVEEIEIKVDDEPDDELGDRDTSGGGSAGETDADGRPLRR